MITLNALDDIGYRYKIAVFILMIQRLYRSVSRSGSIDLDE
jgi:hypothetical protein